MIIYGIKNCDKVRDALKQAKQAGENVRLHDFRSDGIDAQLLEAMLADIELSQLINKRSTTYRQLESKDNIGIETLIAHPTLIKRPVVLSRDQFTIGLP
ncbi:MAG: arsenate reductase [Proteobacteria bacterium]|nr:MAG: arsenate reductase [Pseudomonadota bacterium]